jgi:hypothetical protein
MIRFKHKETGEVIELSRVRTYINNDGTKYNVDVTSNYDLSDYEEIKEQTDYSSIICTKAPNDRR